VSYLLQKMEEYRVSHSYHQYESVTGQGIFEEDTFRRAFSLPNAQYGGDMAAGFPKTNPRPMH
jgi:hypothetical protein